MHITAALDELRACHIDLQAAREAALTAATGLAGARATRAEQLANLLADALAFAQRLAFVVEAESAASARNLLTVRINLDD